jgi:hypothetical protein
MSINLYECASIYKHRADNESHARHVKFYFSTANHQKIADEDAHGGLECN